MSTEKFLVADIGGTNVRFALASLRQGELMLGPTVSLRTAAYRRLDDALEAVLDAEGRPPLAAAAICAAGPVRAADEGGVRIALTNCPWDVTEAAIARVTGVAAPRLMNDFAALALAIPALTPADIRRLGAPGTPVPGAPAIVIGAGTGLGVSALLPDGARAHVVAGEGGHVDLAPQGPREMAVLSHLQAQFGHVSAERVLSGPGLATLHAALVAIDGAAPAPLTPEEVAIRAHGGQCPQSREAVALFCGWLGAVAGDAALTLGARGGVYIAGGIVPGWVAAMPGLFDENLFRARFEAKGRLEFWMKDIPSFVVTRADAALLGLARAVRADIV
ncbi:glucokinase [Parvibaculum sp.]|uniref:glucokinase n=1 Tax=Parvibaculum sp. TaxID=2024848 RepID=UPI001DAA7015|nr:glucokinase [Parvibaculum sp.]MBX3490137.1 glucokinase [Parvibaculum sp.]MCW5725875.1 glucokinase [Parvibaculum sp.]